MRIPYQSPQKVTANGLEIMYDAFGSRQAPPLLLIMGLGGQLIAWDADFCQMLAANGYWVIRFDNRDVGLSTHFDEVEVPNIRALMLNLTMGRSISAPYLLKDMAADTIGLLDALNIDRAHMIGISMGGMILQEIMIRHRQRVQTAVSIMSTTGRPGLPQATRQARQRLLKAAPSKDKAAYLDYVVNLWRVLHGDGYPFDENGFRQRGAQAFDRGIYPAGTGRQMAAILASGSRAQQLKEVTTPTLVMHGQIDPLVPVACGIDTAECIPNAQLRLFEGMGHYLHPELWPDFVSAISNHAH